MGKNLSKKICNKCGYVHGSDDARAINRFSAKKETLYVARHGGKHRRTREEAERDECAYMQITKGKNV